MAHHDGDGDAGLRDGIDSRMGLDVNRISIDGDFCPFQFPLEAVLGEKAIGFENGKFIAPEAAHQSIRRTFHLQDPVGEDEKYVISLFRAMELLEQLEMTDVDGNKDVPFFRILTEHFPHRFIESPGIEEAREHVVTDKVFPVFIYLGRNGHVVFRSFPGVNDFHGDRHDGTAREDHVDRLGMNFIEPVPHSFLLFHDRSRMMGPIAGAVAAA